MQRLVGVVAGGMCVVLVAAGCGSSSKKTLSKAEFLKQGNAICAKGNAEINAAGQKLPKRRPTRAELVKFSKETVIPSVERQINGVAALKPPPADRAKVKALVASARRALDKIKANPALAALSGPRDPFADANRQANAYGLTKCGGSNS